MAHSLLYTIAFDRYIVPCNALWVTQDQYLTRNPPGQAFNERKATRYVQARTPTCALTSETICATRVCMCVRLRLCVSIVTLAVQATSNTSFLTSLFALPSHSTLIPHHSLYELFLAFSFMWRNRQGAGLPVILLPLALYILMLCSSIFKMTNMVVLSLRSAGRAPLQPVSLWYCEEDTGCETSQDPRSEKLTSVSRPPSLEHRLGSLGSSLCVQRHLSVLWVELGSATFISIILYTVPK